MSLQRTRPIDTLQRIMSSLKHFEKKLDKLQDDVKYHGHTLSELRVMMASLSAGTMMTPDIQLDSMKRSVNNSAIQYDENLHVGPVKTKRKRVMQPFPSKLTSKSLQGQKYGINPNKEVPYRKSGTPLNPKAVGKLLTRHRKAEATRKMTTFRAPNQQRAMRSNLMS